MLLPLSILALACAPQDDVPPQMDREPGVRAPNSASCDPQDPLRCHLHWPSNTFSVVDADCATGLRLAIDDAELPIEDDPRGLDLADGFSRITKLATGFDVALDVASLDGSLLLLVAQPDHPDYGQLVPLELEPSIEAVDGLTSDPGPLRGASALEQLRVAGEEMFEIHDFVDDDTQAAQAAMEQLTHFAATALEGTPEIVHPAACPDNTADGSCDFGE